MRREELYLRDILEAANDIEEFLSGIDQQKFLADKLLKSAVLQKLSVIGEAAVHLSKIFEESHPQVPWKQIAAFRNIVIHQYFAVEWQIVWEAATGDTPLLKKQVEKILSEEFPSQT
jgi:uncharacterized protein with HEPN domain